MELRIGCIRVLCRFGQNFGFNGNQNVRGIAASFYYVFIKLTDNKNRHNVSDIFDFAGQVSTISMRVTMRVTRP